MNKHMHRRAIRVQSHHLNALSLARRIDRLRIHMRRVIQSGRHALIRYNRRPIMSRTLNVKIRMSECTVTYHVRLIRVNRNHFNHFSNLVNLTQRRRISNTRALLIGVINGHRHRIQHILTVSRHANSLENRANRFKVTCQFSSLRNSLNLFRKTRQHIPNSVIRFISTVLRRIRSLSDRSNAVLYTRRIDNHQARLAINRFKLLLKSNKERPTIHRIRINTSKFRAAFTIRIRRNARRTMNFLKVIGPDNIRSLRRNVANRNSNSRVTRNKVTTRRARQVVIRTNNPVDAIDTSTLTTSATRIITYTDVIQRTRHRFISVSTLRRIFRLQVSKHDTVNIDEFNHNLVHDVHEQSNAITYSPNHTTFIAKHHLPRHLLVNSKTNQITVRVAVFKINFKARAPRVTAT